MSTPPKRRPEWLMPLVGLAAFLVVSIGLAVLRDRLGLGAATAQSSAKAPASGGVGVSGKPDADAVVDFEPPDTESVPSVWIDVAQPAKVREALFANEWVQQVLKEPLGRGFAGPWAPFLGSKGEDLKASFSGTVLSLFTGQLLSAPFQVVWFNGNGGNMGPVVVVPEPGSGARAAFEAMGSAAGRGGFSSNTCPGGAAAPGGSVQMTRWLLAEHAVYAAQGESRLVFGKDPRAVLQGVCAELPEVPQDAADLEIAFSPERLGREEGQLANGLGLGKVVRLQFTVTKATFAPKGLAAEVVTANRLDAAPLAENLLKAIPEETSVMLTLQLKLPEQLTGPNIAAFWKGQGAEKALTRQVAFLWNPRGDERGPLALAMVWSRPEDGPALERLFSGARLAKRPVCGNPTLAWDDGMLRKLEAACAGQVPNVLHAAPAVVAGLRAPTSIGLGVHLGHLLPKLAVDGYWSDSTAGVSKSSQQNVLPPEMESAKKALEALPFMGFSGTAQGNSWTPGGFRS